MLQTLTCFLVLSPDAVVEEWSKGVNAYLCNQEQFPFPREGLVAQFCGAIYPIFHYAAVNWLGFKEEEVRSAASHSWGCSGDVHMGGSVYAQWGVSRGVRGGGMTD